MSRKIIIEKEHDTNNKNKIETKINKQLFLR